MRTATTLVKSHDGKWDLLSGPDVEMHLQKKSFNDLLNHKTHKQFNTVRYHESDGYFREIHFSQVVAEKKSKETVKQ